MKTQNSILVICTGGTIAMQKTKTGYRPERGHLQKAMAKIPELQNPEMPHYVFYEYDEPIDSANMTPTHWARLAQDITTHYHQYDGFVILHGTDTMAYTASALSFMLENLSKPVILTGSQLPLFEMRNDAHENLINALIIAAHYPIPEVCIFFNNALYRGNRCKKVSAARFQAFDSPNYPALATVGIDIDLNREYLRPYPHAPFKLQLFSAQTIGVLRLFPGLSMSLIKSLLTLPALKAIVLETYGSGTAPEDKTFIETIVEATYRGIIIVNCSQCLHAKVNMSTYTAGLALANSGVIAGIDMTLEATIAKLHYLLSQPISLDELKLNLVKDLRGELTEE